MLFAPAAHAQQPDADELLRMVSADRIDKAELVAYGPGAIPGLIHLYADGDEQQRARVADAFYVLGSKSPEAQRLLMQDVHSQNQRLRLAVQWALGRVSDDPRVVDALLQNMQHDGNPLFRDKAACALAYDQIHLDPQQKVRLFSGLIDGLSSETTQVRKISLQALQIHAGQTKGYNPTAPAEERAIGVERWKRWLEDYRSTL